MGYLAWYPISHVTGCIIHDCHKCVVLDRECMHLVIGGHCRLHHVLLILQLYWFRCRCCCCCYCFRCFSSLPHHYCSRYQQNHHHHHPTLKRRHTFHQ